MLSYLFMKALEGRPRSYDDRMDRISGGRVGAVKEAVAASLRPGDRVLEIGCGTGELAAMVIARGVTVHGFDVSLAMVATARDRAAAEGIEDRFEVEEMGIEGMDRLRGGAYDAVMATLVLSELADHERAWALRHAYRVLVPGGRLVVADEVVPANALARAAQTAVRLPMLAGAMLVSGSITRPLADLPADVREAAFVVDEEERSQGGAFAILRAHRPQEAA